MSKKQFLAKRQVAIDWCIAWRDYLNSEMEAALEADHTSRANELFTAANRSENTADILRKISRADFAKWIAQYETTGIATLGTL